MVLAVGHVELEALQLETGTDGEASPVGRSAFGVADLHLTGTAEVVAGSDVEGLTQQHVGTDGQMTAEALTPVVESAEGGREAQRRLSDALGGTHLQV